MAVDKIVTGLEEREINGPFKPPFWDNNPGTKNGQHAYDNSGIIDGDAGPIYWNGSAWVKYGTGSGSALVFSTMAAMRAIPLLKLNAAVPVELLGYYAAGDGGGGLFYWSAASAVTDDAGTYIKPTAVAVNGRLIRIYLNGDVSVRFYGAKGDNSQNDTVFINNAAAYVRSITIKRQNLYFPAGFYISGKIDITAVYSIRGDNGRTTINGIASNDVIYWKGLNEAGYVDLTDLYIRDLIVNVNDSVDVSGSIGTRIGFGGEVIGNCAINLPHGVRVFFDNLHINSTNGPGSGVGNRACGIFFAGDMYGANFGTNTIIRSIDYGVISGTSNTYTGIIPVKVSSFDGVTGTFTTVGAPAATNTRTTLIFDTNDGDLGVLLPRTQYFIVNATGTTFQVALTSGGTAITFTATGTPVVYAVPCGSNSVEYANDEWSWLQLTTVTKRVGLSVANISYSHLGTYGCQSNMVSIRVLNYPSVNRASSWNCTFAEFYTEGPLYTTIMIGKEYCRIEGERLNVLMGPYCNSNTVLNNFLTISGDGNIINNCGVRNNKLLVSGNGNIVYVKSDNGDADIINRGNNDIIMRKRSSGVSAGTGMNISNSSYARPYGGYSIDAISKGSIFAQWQSDTVLFHPAIKQTFQSAPAFTNLYDDATLIEVPGYTRKTTSGALGVRNALGSNSQQIIIGRYFPKGKWRLYAKVRSANGGSQSFTLSVVTVTGTPGTTPTHVKSIGTTWDILQIDIDSTSATDDYSVQFNATAPSGSWDLAYFAVVPYGAEMLTNSINFGGPVKLSGIGDPNGVVTAPVGSEYTWIGGVAGTIAWGKQTGTGNTGWVPIW